ncbi:hypothetical protein ACO2Q0_20675 [Phenylobacterium sp. VNQ135]|uniref:hypothetical protein n=1 Tax=Phenylobacterium sp. VNQ135 TaxID=3400922 RepID=UPI003C0CDA16
MTRVEAPQRHVWKQLTEALGLAGADVGDEITAPRTPEPLSFAVERVEQEERQRYVLPRLDQPAPGAALVGPTASARPPTRA